MNLHKFSPLTIEEQNMAKDQILTPELLEQHSIHVSDPNNIISETFSELKKLPKEFLDHLGEVTINIEYQLTPQLQVKFKK